MGDTNEVIQSMKKKAILNDLCNNSVMKWNPKLHKYEDYKPKFPITMHSEDMSLIVNCCQCGKKVEYGKTYTSLEVHNNNGFGYAVCGECYNEEYKRKYNK